MSEGKSSASQRAASHLNEAAQAIDAQFGQGYAAANPALVAAMVQASAIESAVLAGERAAQMADGTANRAVERLCGSIEYLKPRLF